MLLDRWAPLKRNCPPSVRVTSTPLAKIKVGHSCDLTVICVLPLCTRPRLSQSFHHQNRITFLHARDITSQIVPCGPHTFDLQHLIPGPSLVNFASCSIIHQPVSSSGKPSCASILKLRCGRLKGVLAFPRD